MPGAGLTGAEPEGPGGAPARARRPAAGRGAHSQAAAGGPAGRRLAATAAVAGGLTALGVCWYQLAQPHVLYGVVQYDDGVYLASSLQLAAGRLPYRDFALIQPPGVPVLMLPIAFLAHLVGSRGAMALARVVTAAVCALDTALAGWLLRHRGLAASLVAAGLMATFPANFSADRSLLLEPYLVMFLLAGTALAFSGDRIAARWQRLALAGACFGAAGATKAWAIFPFAVLVLVLAAPERLGPGGWAAAARARLVPLLAGTAGAFALLAGPFFAADPAAFVRDVVVAQFARTARSVTPAAQRFAYLLGVRQSAAGRPPSSEIGVEVALAVAVVLVLALAVPLLARRASPLEAFALLAAVVSTAIMFVPQTFYSHYAYLPDAYLAIALALALDRCRRLLLAPLRPAAGPGRRRGVIALGATLTLAALAGAGALVASETGYARSVLARTGDPGPAIAAAVPAGSCALSDAASVLISADRYSTAGGCPALVDPTGQSIATDPSRPALERGSTAHAGDPLLDRFWEERLAAARYLVTLQKVSKRIPWDPALSAWFAARYRLVAVSGAFIFENRRPGAAPG